MLTYMLSAFHALVRDSHKVAVDVVHRLIAVCLIRPLLRVRVDPVSGLLPV